MFPVETQAEAQGGRPVVSRYSGIGATAVIQSDPKMPCHWARFAQRSSMEAHSIRNHHHQSFSGKNSEIRSR